MYSNNSSTSFLYLNETPDQIIKKIREHEQEIEKLKAKLSSFYGYEIQYPSAIDSTANNCTNK